MMCIPMNAMPWLPHKNEKERKDVCVCVCERERERERESYSSPRASGKLRELPENGDNFGKTPTDSG